MRCVLHAICLGLMGLVPLHAWSLPSIQGQIAGQLALHGFGTAPEINWRLQAEPNADGDNRITAWLTADGLDVELEVQAPRKSASMTWRIVKGELDLAVWWRPLIARVGLSGLPVDFTLSGVAQLAGEGVLEGSDLRGEFTAVMAGGGAGSVTQGWQVPQVKLLAQLVLDLNGPWLKALQLDAADANVAGLKVTQISLAASGEPSQQLRMDRVTLNALGGRITIRPFVFDLANPAIDTSANLENVSLADLAELVPEALAEASGRASGRINVRWSPRHGLQPGGGALTMTPDAPASIRLTSTPGFLTRHTNERIQWVPAMFGSLAKWLALENPAYETLRQIELGQQLLQVEKLRIELYPDGPAGARSATAEIAARPAKGGVVDRVSFTINVAGPLDEVLRLSTNEQVKFKVGVKP